MDATVSALRNRNIKLSKAMAVLKNSSNHKDLHVASLKRKMQQETLVRKCKERQIAFLASKVVNPGLGADEEIAALREEVDILREQLEAQPTESVEWMLKYKVAEAKIEEMEANATETFEGGEKLKLEASLVTLLDEKISLQKKVENMSNMSKERNDEIDLIISDVTKLENANILMQSQFDKRDLALVESENKIQYNQAQLGKLQESLTGTLNSLELTQSELAAKKEKTVELQEALGNIRIEVN
jgi:chromosome segregation ATPase